MLVFEGLSAAKYRADGGQTWAIMKGEYKRSTKGTLRLLLTFPGRLRWEPSPERRLLHVTWTKAGGVRWRPRGAPQLKPALPPIMVDAGGSVTIIGKVIYTIHHHR